MSFIGQSLIIILPIAIVMFFKSLFLSLIVPSLGILLAFYLMLSKRKRNENLNFFILTSLILILVTSTGELWSPFLFLLYFLSFGIAFVLDPRVVFVFTVGLLALLFPKALETDLTRNLILLFSFILLSPIAFFLGIAYQNAKRRNNQTTNTTNKKPNKKIDKSSAFFLRGIEPTHKKKPPNPRSKLRGFKKALDKSRIALHSGLIGLLGYLFIGLFLPAASGQTMSNEDYIIKTQLLNAVSGLTESIDYKVRSTVGDANPATSEGVNFKVKTGFENIVAELPFSVTLSSDFVDFGALSPTNTIIRTIDLTLHSLSTYGYSVVASENNLLKSDKLSIPDTTCDNGGCNSENVGIWLNALTYGFGYRCDNLIGFDCDRSFVHSNLYKSFPDTGRGQIPLSVMAGVGSKNKSSRISYKVNISASQAQGIYSNVITYIAVPNF